MVPSFSVYSHYRFSSRQKPSGASPARHTASAKNISLDRHGCHKDTPIPDPPPNQSSPSAGPFRTDMLRGRAPFRCDTDRLCLSENTTPRRAESRDKDDKNSIENSMTKNRPMPITTIIAMNGISVKGFSQSIHPADMKNTKRAGVHEGEKRRPGTSFLFTIYLINGILYGSGFRLRIVCRTALRTGDENCPDRRFYEDCNDRAGYPHAAARYAR